MEHKQEIDVLVDLQFGSTGKGALAGWLARLKKYDTVITAWMPNAGHTYIDQAGNKMIHTALANGCVSPHLVRVMIAPASVVDVDALARECAQAEKFGYMRGVRVLIHENATILQPKHSEFERSQITGIGSTQKGSGAAIMAKLMRNPKDNPTAGALYPRGMVTASQSGAWSVEVVAHEYWLNMQKLAQNVLVEGAQGYSLGINSGFYPYTTSRECTVAQVCSDTLISPDRVTRVYGCARTYPIRVANRYDENGIMTGYSGDGYYDQYETSFERIKQEQETTTVTKLPRRIFTFSKVQIKEAIEANMPSKMVVFLNFANYMNTREEWKKGEAEKLNEVIDAITPHAKVGYLGFGAKHQDMQIVN